MLLRKILAYLITSVLTVLLLIIILFLQGDYETIKYSFLIAYIAFAVIFLYGLPVSIMADIVTKPFEVLGLSLARTLISLVIHLMFGLGFVFIYAFVSNSYVVFGVASELEFIASTLASFLFWLSDAILKIKFRKHKEIRVN